MDGIFGHKNFRNEIVWGYRTGGVSKKWFGRKHDIILSYTKNIKKSFFNPIKEKSYNRDYKKYGFKGIKEYKDDKCFICCEKLSKNKGYYTISSLRDVWDDINALGRTHNERLGYQTQKPIKLLDRIIKASCPENGIVLDPFCGCGTTIYSAVLNRRKWIGIDIAILSTRLVKETLNKRYDIQEDSGYKIDGIPVSVEQARALWKKDKFQFQNWAVEYTMGFCTNKKTRDGGVDGRLYFKDKNNDLQCMIISVKGGGLKAQDVRDLIGTIEKEKAIFGGLISFDKPSKDMIQASIKMGKYKDRYGFEYPIIQFLTIEEMINDKKLFNIPNNINRKDYKKDKQTRFYI